MLFVKRERLIRRILIVEDEPLVAFDNEHRLTEAGYEVAATVDCLADALAVIESEPLDLVMTDLALNGDGDGHDVARAARAKSVPVLFVTAHCSDEGRTLGLACLTKPYSMGVLERALGTLDQAMQGTPPKRLPKGMTLFDIPPRDGEGDHAQHGGGGPETRTEPPPPRR